nr:hypothetical protein Iba_chr09fCG13180 [Ipomoea batatas]
MISSSSSSSHIGEVVEASSFRYNEDVGKSGSFEHTTSAQYLGLGAKPLTHLVSKRHMHLCYGVVERCQPLLTLHELESVSTVLRENFLIPGLTRTLTAVSVSGSPGIRKCFGKVTVTATTMTMTRSIPNLCLSSDIAP